MQRAFDVMTGSYGHEVARAKVDAWVTIARELRSSDEAVQSQVQKIVAEAKPV